MPPILIQFAKKFALDFAIQSGVEIVNYFDNQNIKTSHSAGGGAATIAFSAVKFKIDKEKYKHSICSYYLMKDKLYNFHLHNEKFTQRRTLAERITKYIIPTYSSSKMWDHRKYDPLYDHIFYNMTENDATEILNRSNQEES